MKWGDFEGDHDCVVCAAAMCERLRGRDVSKDSAGVHEQLEELKGVESRSSATARERQAACRRSGAASSQRRAPGGRPARSPIERKSERVLFSLDSESFSSGIIFCDEVGMRELHNRGADFDRRGAENPSLRVGGIRRDCNFCETVHVADQRRCRVLSRTNARAVGFDFVPSMVGWGDYLATGCGIDGIMRLGHSPTACTSQLWNSNGRWDRRCFSGCADVRFLGANPPSHDWRGGALDIAHIYTHRCIP